MHQLEMSRSMQSLEASYNPSILTQHNSSNNDIQIFEYSFHKSTRTRKDNYHQKESKSTSIPILTSHQYIPNYITPAHTILITPNNAHRNNIYNFSNNNIKSQFQHQTQSNFSISTKHLFTYDNNLSHFINMHRQYHHTILYKSIEAHTNDFTISTHTITYRHFTQIESPNNSTYTIRGGILTSTIYLQEMTI